MCYNLSVPYPNDLQRTIEDVEGAWALYRAEIQDQVDAGVLAKAEGEQLCSEGHKAAWMRQYLLTRCGMKF